MPATNDDANDVYTIGDAIDTVLDYAVRGYHHMCNKDNMHAMRQWMKHIACALCLLLMCTVYTMLCLVEILWESGFRRLRASMHIHMKQMFILIGRELHVGSANTVLSGRLQRRIQSCTTPVVANASARTPVISTRMPLPRRIVAAAKYQEEQQHVAAESDATPDGQPECLPSKPDAEASAAPQTTEKEQNADNAAMPLEAPTEKEEKANDERSMMQATLDKLKGVSISSIPFQSLLVGDDGVDAADDLIDRELDHYISNAE